MADAKYIKVPNWRWRKIQMALKSQTAPDDSFLVLIYDVMIGKTEDETIQYVVDLIENPIHRDSVVAYFLSRAPIPRIAKGLSIPEKVLEIFGLLFMDLSVFRNKLEIRDYAEYYIKNCCENDTTRAEIKVGYTNGPSALDFQWMPEESFVTEKQVTRAALSLSYSKMLVARDAPVLSAACREGFKWANFALRAAPVSNAIQDRDEEEMTAAAAIEKHRESKNLKQLGLSPEELLH